MNNKSIILVVVLFVAIVLGMFVFAYLKKSELVVPPTNNLAITPTDTDAYDVTQIDGKHYYIDGVHTVVGEIALPTPCDLLVSTSSITAEPDRISLNFNVINNSESCATVVTNARFSVSAVAPRYIPFVATFMGVPVALNFTEAEPGELPEEFEVYIKG